MARHEAWELDAVSWTGDEGLKGISESVALVVCKLQAAWWQHDGRRLPAGRGLVPHGGERGWGHESGHVKEWTAETAGLLWCRLVWGQSKAGLVWGHHAAHRHVGALIGLRVGCEYRIWPIWPCGC